MRQVQPHPDLHPCQLVRDPRNQGHQNTHRAHESASSQRPPLRVTVWHIYKRCKTELRGEEGGRQKHEVSRLAGLTPDMQCALEPPPSCQAHPLPRQPSPEMQSPPSAPTTTHMWVALQRSGDQGEGCCHWPGNTMSMMERPIGGGGRQSLSMQERGPTEGAGGSSVTVWKPALEKTYPPAAQDKGPMTPPRPPPHTHTQVAHS